jgi:hypothetical protein
MPNELPETTDLVREMQQYYDRRAPVYDQSMGYDDPAIVEAIAPAMILSTPHLPWIGLLTCRSRASAPFSWDCIATSRLGRESVSAIKRHGLRRGRGYTMPRGTISKSDSCQMAHAIALSSTFSVTMSSLGSSSHTLAI